MVLIHATQRLVETILAITPDRGCLNGSPGLQFATRDPRPFTSAATAPSPAKHHLGINDKLSDRLVVS